jgi:4-amino-4-deoxy-L-arabinose transferase-like glycosyltransferase
MERALHGVEGNVPGTGPLFFANQVIVMLGPAAAIALWRVRRIDFTRDSLSSLALVAFLVPFLLSSLSLTKLRTYALPMLPPLALLAGEGLSEFWRKNRPQPLAVAGIIVFTVWASSQSLRDSVKDLFMDLEVSPGLFIVAGATAIFLALTRKKIRGKGIVALSLAGSLLLAIPAPVEYTRSDIARAAKDFEESGCRSLVYVDKYLARTSPQVSYYFEGIDLGWREGYRFRFIGPDDEIGVDSLSKESSYVILHVARHPEASSALEGALRKIARQVLANEWYRVYAVRGSQDSAAAVE